MVLLLFGFLRQVGQAGLEHSALGLGLQESVHLNPGSNFRSQCRPQLPLRHTQDGGRVAPRIRGALRPATASPAPHLFLIGRDGPPALFSGRLLARCAISRGVILHCSLEQVNKQGLLKSGPGVLGRARARPQRPA
jgi:hypothetical protein